MLCPVCGRYPDKDGDYIEQQGGDRAKHKYCKQCRVKHVEFLLEEGLDKESFLTTWSSVNNGLFSDVKLVAKHGQAVPSHKAVLVQFVPLIPFHAVSSLALQSAKVNNWMKTSR